MVIATAASSSRLKSCWFIIEEKRPRAVSLKTDSPFTILSSCLPFSRMEENLPPGFRFHPTDEELITYYLTNKVSDFSFAARAIADVDLNKCEPWDLPGIYINLIPSTLIIWILFLILILSSIKLESFFFSSFSSKLLLHIKYHH